MAIVAVAVILMVVVIVVAAVVVILRPIIVVLVVVVVATCTYDDHGDIDATADQETRKGLRVAMPASLGVLVCAFRCGTCKCRCEYFWKCVSRTWP